MRFSVSEYKLFINVSENHTQNINFYKDNGNISSLTLLLLSSFKSIMSDGFRKHHRGGISHDAGVIHLAIFMFDYNNVNSNI